MANQAKCPCGTSKPPVFERALPRDLLEKELSQFVGGEDCPEIDLVDYEIWRCKTCDLVFAAPLKQGSERFYNWVAMHSREYYHGRWEYDKLNELFVENAPSSLLDVGCGDGQFIASVAEKHGTDVVGLEIASESIAMGQRNDVSVLKSDLFELDHSMKFDVVTAFHVLEHVEDPYRFVGEMLSHLEPDGRIFLSTPYSPTSIEVGLFQVMNYPPHHLTRWNAMSLRKLAESLGCNLAFHFRKPKSFVKRAVTSFLASVVGPQSQYTKTQLLRAGLRSPFRLTDHLVRQLRREKIDEDNAAPDIVMIELSRK